MSHIQVKSTVHYRTQNMKVKEEMERGKDAANEMEMEIEDEMH